MRFDFGKLILVPVGMFALAIVLVVVYLISSSLLGPEGAGGILASVLSMVIFILIIIAAVVFAILPILAILEVLTSNNEGGFKALWTAVLLFAGFLGLIAYVLIGKKELK